MTTGMQYHGCLSKHSKYYILELCMDAEPCIPWPETGSVVDVRGLALTVRAPNLSIFINRGDRKPSTIS